MSDSAPPRATLRVQVRDHFMEVAVSERSLVVGRAHSCNVRIKDSRVSRLHCKFALRHGSVTVKDLESRTGTYVNHVRIPAHQRVLLRHGDMVRIGDAHFQVFLCSADQSADPIVSIGHDIRSRFAPEDRHEVSVALQAATVHEEGIAQGREFDLKAAILAMDAKATSQSTHVIPDQDTTLDDNPKMRNTGDGAMQGRPHSLSPNEVHERLHSLDSAADTSEAAMKALRRMFGGHF